MTADSVFVAADSASRREFDGVPVTELRLRDVTRYPDSQNIVLDYDVLPRGDESP